jgi:hypothetical protein
MEMKLVQITKKGWLAIGLCLVLVVSLAYNGWQALSRRIAGNDAQSALSTDVDSALSYLDSAVYLSTSQNGWDDQTAGLELYADLLQAKEDAAACKQLAQLNTGVPAAVANQLGDLEDYLNAVYLPAADRLATAQATVDDKASLTGFCKDLQQSGWPLRSQFQSQGYTRLQQSLSGLLSMLGPLPQISGVINVPDYSEDQSAITGNSGQAMPENKPSGKPGITVKVGSGA